MLGNCRQYVCTVLCILSDCVGYQFQRATYVNVPLSCRDIGTAIIGRLFKKVPAEICVIIHVVDLLGILILKLFLNRDFRLKFTFRLGSDRISSVQLSSIDFAPSPASGEHCNHSQSVEQLSSCSR
jgi:hypothetical protein